MEWYRRLGFESLFYPPGFAILRRDDIEIFLQQQDGYAPPDEPGRRERQAWDLYITTDDVRALHNEFAAADVRISRPLCAQEYGMVEFDVIDLNGRRLVFAEPAPSE